MLATQFPMVNAFARAALMHRDAAKILLRACPQKGFSTVATEVIYLSGYVVECSLKALVLTHTPPRRHQEMLNRFKSPQTIGHDLERINVELERRNVRVPNEHREIVRRIRRQWSPQLRYSAANRTTGIAVATFQNANELYRWVSGGKEHG